MCNSSMFRLFFTPPYRNVMAILIVGLCGYANTFPVPLQFDDPPVIGEALKRFTAGGSLITVIGNSRWLVDATFAAERAIHGFAVTGYHIINLIIHMLTACCLYGITFRLLNRNSVIDQSASNFVPVATALLFVSHPVQTEAITYITQRYTSLATLLYLLAAYIFVVLRSESSGVRSHSKHMWLLFVVLALAAMKCKQISITLPVLILVLEWLFFQSALIKKPLFLLLLMALLFVVPVQEIITRIPGNGQQVGASVLQATAETTTISRSSYFFTEQRVIATYLRLLLLPYGQNLDYDYPIFSSLSQIPVIGSASLHLALICCAFYLAIRSRHNNSNRQDGEYFKLISFGILWFYVTISVESSIIPIRDVIFEHRLYLPSAGFFIACTAAVLRAGQILSWQRYLWHGLVIITLVLTILTYQRNRVWGSGLAMWQDVVEKSPDKMRARLNAGLYFAKRSMLEKAIPNLVRAIELEPGNFKNYIYLNHTMVLLSGFENRTSSGREFQDEMESVDPAKVMPWQAISYNNLGLAYEFLNRFQEAANSYHNALKISPDLAEAWFNLALSAYSRRDIQEFDQARRQLVRLESPLIRLLPTFSN